MRSPRQYSLERDYRQHDYLVRCEQCDRWHEIHPKAPNKADLRAIKHAKKNPGHRAYVLNLTLLELFTEHRHDPLPVVDSEPPF